MAHRRSLLRAHVEVGGGAHDGVYLRVVAREEREPRGTAAARGGVGALVEGAHTHLVRLAGLDAVGAGRNVGDDGGTGQDGL